MAVGALVFKLAANACLTVCFLDLDLGGGVIRCTGTGMFFFFFPVWAKYKFNTCPIVTINLPCMETIPILSHLYELSICPHYFFLFLGVFRPIEIERWYWHPVSHPLTRLVLPPQFNIIKIWGAHLAILAPRIYSSSQTKTLICPKRT